MILNMICLSKEPIRNFLPNCVTTYFPHILSDEIMPSYFLHNKQAPPRYLRPPDFGMLQSSESVWKSWGNSFRIDKARTSKLTLWSPFSIPTFLHRAVNVKRANNRANNRAKAN